MARTDSISGNSGSRQIDLREFRTNKRQERREERKDDSGFISRVDHRNKKDKGGDQQASTQPVSTPTPVTPTPTPEPTQQTLPTPTPSSNTSPVTDLRSAAERYVAIYEKNSGHTFASADERNAKIQEVQDFYGENANRADRLIQLAKKLEA